MPTRIRKKWSGARGKQRRRPQVKEHKFTKLLVNEYKDFTHKRACILICSLKSYFGK